MTQPHNLQLTREILYHSHRLSHQQIDDFLGENSKSLLLPEKMEQLEFVGEFLNVTDALQSAGINFISVKGPLLSFRIYNDSTCRRSKDFDFLIDFNQIEQSISVLAGLGYVPQYYNWTADNSINQFKKELKNQFHLCNDEKGISLEVHWKLLAYQPIKQTQSTGLVYSNLTQIEFSGRKLSILNPEMDLLYLIIHGGLHAWRRLKWLVDIHEIAVRKLYDAHKFKILVRQFHAERMVSLANEMLSEIYPNQERLPEFKCRIGILHSRSLKKLETESDREYDSLAEAFVYFWFVLTAFPGIKYKLNVIRYLYLSLMDSEDRKKSVFTMLGQILNPVTFLKKRYQV